MKRSPRGSYIDVWELGIDPLEGTLKHKHYSKSKQAREGSGNHQMGGLPGGDGVFGHKKASIWRQI